MIEQPREAPDQTDHWTARYGKSILFIIATLSTSCQ